MTVSHAARTVCSLAVLATACTIQQRGQPKLAATDDHSSHMSAADMAAPRVVSAGDVSLSQGTPGLPASNNNAAARIAASPRHAE